MKLAVVVGAAVSSLKDPRLTGTKLMLLRDADPAGRTTGDQYVAVDAVGAGDGDLVIVVTGTPASWVFDTQNVPVDASIVGIVDAESRGSRSRQSQ